MTITRILTATAVIAMSGAGLTLAPAAVATPVPAKTCTFETSELPRTPDAAEHWYAGCDTSTSTISSADLPRSAVSAKTSTFETSKLPRTPDAAEHWYANHDTSASTISSAGLPRSADAAEAWLAR